MEKQNKLFSLGLVVVAVVALTGVTMVSATGFSGRGQINNKNFDPVNLPADAQVRFAERQAHREEMRAEHEAIKTAIENGDYDTWKGLMQEKINNSPMVQTMNMIDADNFAKFTEMHNLMQEGKIDEANQIRQELGLPEGGGGHGQMMKGENKNKFFRNQKSR